jgi:hypothetical protein
MIKQQHVQSAAVSLSGLPALPFARDAMAMMNISTIKT